MSEVGLVLKPALIKSSVGSLRLTVGEMKSFTEVRTSSKDNKYLFQFPPKLLEYMMLYIYGYTFILRLDYRDASLITLSFIIVEIYFLKTKMISMSYH